MMKTCPDCREPFRAAHPQAVCQSCAEREADDIEDQMARELEARADRAAWDLSFNAAA